MSLSFNENYVPLETFQWDFSLSSSPLGPSTSLKHVLVQALSNNEDLSSYPDQRYLKLVRAIASFYNVAKEQVILGAGLDGLIFDIVTSILDMNDELILPSITFRNPVYAANIKGAVVTQIPMNPDLSIDFERLMRAINPNTKIIFLCNPNNPTGIYESLEAIQNLLESTEALVILDEANIEFSGGSGLSLINQFPHLVVLRTFSKAYGLAGMRVGYGVSQSPLLKKIAATRPPFFISTLSEIAACHAISDQKHLQATIDAVITERKFLESELRILGFTVTPSQSNTLLCRIPKNISSASILIEHLHQHNCHAVNGIYFNLEDCYLRIAPRLHEANKKLIQVLGDILSQKLIPFSC